MDKLNFDLEKKPTKSRKKLYIAIGIIVFVLACWILWNRYKNVLINKVVEKNETKQSDVKSKIVDKKKEIDDLAADFTQSQKALSQKAIEIQKTTNYEKPIIENADYNVMVDSLSRAQPD